MGRDFVSYALQELSRKKIIKHAAQYNGINMAELIGADEDNFPFLVQSEGDECHVMFWNAYNGFMEFTDEDPVRAYSAVQYLKQNAYPVFRSFDDAQVWAREHNWPRKQREGATDA